MIPGGLYPQSTPASSPPCWSGVLGVASTFAELFSFYRSGGPQHRLTGPRDRRLYVCHFTGALACLFSQSVSTNLYIINCFRGTVAWELRKCSGLYDTNGFFAPCSCVTLSKALSLSES